MKLGVAVASSAGMLRRQRAISALVLPCLVACSQAQPEAAGSGLGANAAKEPVVTSAEVAAQGGSAATSPAHTVLPAQHAAPAAQPTAAMASPLTATQPVAAATTLQSQSAAGSQAPSDPLDPQRSEWRSIGYDAASTYFNRVETKLNKDNVKQLKLAWQVDIGGDCYGAPLQVADKIYVAGPGDVRALDAASGEELWRFEERSVSTPSFADGVLYLNTSLSSVIAIDATSGALLWRRQFEPQNLDGYSSVVAIEDRLLVGAASSVAELSGGTFRGFMAALDRANGEIRWTSYTVPETANGAGIFSSPSADVTARLAFGTTANNYGLPATDTSDAFIAFDLDSGDIVWKFQAVANDTFGANVPDENMLDYNFGANPVLYETEVAGQSTKLVTAAEKGGSIHAIRRDDGTRLWTRKLSGGSADGSRGVMNNTTWSGKHILVASNEYEYSTLFALDGATGEIAWQRKLAGLVWSRISVANGVGFVGHEKVLEAFDADSGELLYSYETDGTLSGVVTIADGRVAFGEGMSWIRGTSGKLLRVLTVP
jgi:polyvinyl alcohol dehydrogenase (cytochrome)